MTGDEPEDGAGTSVDPVVCRGHWFPQALPNGTHLLYRVSGPPETAGIYVARTDGSESRRLLDLNVPVAYAVPGFLLTVRNGALLAQGFDLDALALVDGAVPVADNVATGDSEDAVLSTSTNGHIVYRTNAAQGQRQLVWYDRTGTELSRIGSAEATAQGPDLSPDGRTLAVTRTIDGNRDVWLLDMARSVFTRLTFDPAADMSPLWSADGARVFFASTRTGRLGLYVKTVGGSTESVVLVTAQNLVASGLSPDGRTLLYLSADPKTLLDVWALPLGGGRTPFPVVASPREDLNAQVAPNGQWIAYQSNESGRHEVSVRPYPNGRPTQVTVDGGTQPHWRADGRELFFLDLQGRLMAAPLSFPPGGGMEVGKPTPLFQTRIGGPGISQKEFLVSSDGRFLLDTPVGDASRPLTVILNWQPAP